MEAVIAAAAKKAPADSKPQVNDAVQRARSVAASLYAGALYQTLEPMLDTAAKVTSLHPDGLRLAVPDMTDACLSRLLGAGPSCHTYLLINGTAPMAYHAAQMAYAWRFFSMLAFAVCVCAVVGVGLRAPASADFEILPKPQHVSAVARHNFAFLRCDAVHLTPSLQPQHVPADERHVTSTFVRRKFPQTRAAQRQLSVISLMDGLLKLNLNI
ncbi:hypothetical protein JKP88DRAFT_268247 [Tribonema minus]|uniref:Uncharacterized protein n=1 Tax=Tribonema minus TaxID=303371 RepID=A0A836CHU0_9STRA|nr:hypothetical protein JKP88DRAFT_268247 [Tribonema minus]